MVQSKLNFCFCTLAFGNVYRALAKELVQDLEKYAPGIPVVLFTDKPRDFKTYKNAIVFNHKRHGILLFHERRFAIAKALSMANSCVYLDADVRICAPVPTNIKWLPGITARSCASMNKRFRSRLAVGDSPRPDIVKILQVYKKMAEKIGVNSEDDRTIWINEFLFVVTKDSGRELEFLGYWERLALYADLNGLHKHPAYAIGLAAVKAGFPIRHDEMEGFDFFDDRIEKVRIKNGQSDPAAKQKYFETQEKVEQRYRSLPHKVMDKIMQPLCHHYHTARLQITTSLTDFDFYHR